MRRVFHLSAIIALLGFASCQKQQTEEERNAEVERQVQQRLAAEHQAEEQQQLAQRESELDAREKALKDKEAAAGTKVAAPVARTTRGVSTDNATASYSTFYTKLEPQGAWRETAAYGYVWQPREAQESRTWRPYTNGHWVYTDVGWTWVSEEPFGWATYHYGRWTRLRNIGWVWVPGDEWAPAWVSWRKGDDYIGWAPLPPEARFDRASGIHNWADNYYDIGPDQYCFVATNQLGAQRVERVIVPPEQNVTIVTQTTNITNITYNNTTIVNQGPNYDELRTRTLQPIPRLRLERQINVNFENPRSIVKGEVIEVPAPAIARAQPAERPRNVKETIPQIPVDHGWEAIADRQAAEKVRVKIRSEATPPANAPPKTFVKPAQANAPTAPFTSPAAASTAVTTEAAPAPTSIPPTAQTQNAAASSTRTPSPATGEEPTSTPVRHQIPIKSRSPGPLESVSPAPAASASPSPNETSPAPAHTTISPGVNATRSPGAAPGMTPRATVNPRTEKPGPSGTRRSPTPLGTPVGMTPTASPSASAAPETSATASANPPISAAISGSTSGTPGESRDQRESAKELRKQEKAMERQQKKEQPEEKTTRAHETQANPTITPNSLGSSSASSPSNISSPSLNDARELRKQEKKQQKRARESASEPAESVSPSPSTAPQ
jgi:hypothetical protein